MKKTYKIALLIIPALLIVSFALFSMQSETQTSKSSTLEIPFWVKDKLNWWAHDKITDNQASEALLWYSGMERIKISVVDGQTQIPASLKNDVNLWNAGKISDNDFFATVRSNIENGSIKFSSNTNFDINDYLQVSYSGYSPLFQTFAYQKDTKIENGVTSTTNLRFDRLPNQTENYAKLSDVDRKAVVILPLFTNTAYKESGFYDYYNGVCDEKCLTRQIAYGEDYSSTASSSAIQVLNLLDYDMITDIDVDLNPDILSNYDKVIVLHNEYVTQKEFDAITGHHNVIYLYPNALYAKISADYGNDRITLIRGHGYPDKSLGNGFEWEYDNSAHEYDYCENWQFHDVKNGKMLNCYPERIVFSDVALLKALKDY